MKNKSVGLICFTIILLGLSPNFALAEISHPYLVDEKDQVIFGDSIAIERFDGQATTTYYGLENYSQDYVGGYAHFYFTYTHVIGNFASYPPRVYVTSIDPREPSLLLQVSNLVAYQLSPHTDQSDWYTYDIQFNSTGYTVVVKRAGETEIFNQYFETPSLTDNDWVSIANIYPTFGSPSIHSMAFTPVPIRENGRNLDPVIIIPGIMGSAKKNGQLVLDPILHTYDDLVATLLANGYEENVTLFKFPYEWRDSNTFTADKLANKINEVKEICSCKKVDLVAHSMGGLVARWYIQQKENRGDDVDQLIFLGTPHKGSPKAYLQWEAGQTDVDFESQMTKSFFQAEAVKNGHLSIFNYIHDHPLRSVQELLPIFSYIKEDSSGELRPYPANYPENTFLEVLETTMPFLLNSGIKITNIIGNSGENKTIERIRVRNTDHSKFWEHGEPVGFSASIGDNGLERSVGDNTVTILGSTIDTSVQNEIINGSHNALPSLSSEKIYKILSGKSPTIVINNGTNLEAKMLIVQLLSPIDVVVTAPDGKKIGKNFQTGTEYNEISDAFYSGFQTDEEYITILNPLDGEYKVEIQGTGNGGRYGVLTSYASDVFATTTRIDGATQPNQVTTLKVKVDNDAPEDLSTEKVVTTEVLLNDIKQSYQLGWITDTKTYTMLTKYAESLTKAQNMTTNAKGPKIKQIFAKIFDGVAARAMIVELRALKRNKINEQAYNLIKSDLEYLINNN